MVNNRFETRFWTLLTAAALGLAAQESAEAPPLDLIQLMNTPIQLASHVKTQRLRQPVSVTTISRREIENSGARTLSELLTRFVPGFFTVEDIDDTIAGFRGLAADSNSKTMLMLNGHVLNAEWFWGPPDSILNGINLDYIDRIEVLRGPGSVTLGPGALLGVINVLTKQGTEGSTETRLLAGGGKDGAWSGGAEHASGSESLQTYFHFSRAGYRGQPIRAEGSGLQAWQGFQQLPDNSLKVYQGGGRLKQATAETFVGNVVRGNFECSLLWMDQTRDLYNYYRDRNAYEQSLTSLAAAYRFGLGTAGSLKLKGGFENDDYSLHSHSGLLMGGVRENRFNLQLLYNLTLGALDMALGAEGKRYEMGKRNREGNNFILNQASAQLLDLNRPGHRYVIPDTVEVKSLFGEVFYSPNERWDFFAAGRYDTHPYWGSSLTPRLGLLYHPGEEWGARLSYQTGFRGAPGVHYSGGFQGDGLIRAANYDKIASATGGAVPDPGKVVPELMKSFELELRYSPDWRWQVQAIAFRNVIDHVIDYATYSGLKADPNFPKQIGTDVAGDWVAKYGYWFYKSNPGRLVSQGLEVVAQFKNRNWDSSFSYSKAQLMKADPGNIGTMYLADAAKVGNHFKGYPEDVYRMHLYRRVGEVYSVGLNGLYYPKWYTTDRSMEGNTLLNLTLSGRWDHLKVSLSLHNLLNQVRVYPITARTGINEATLGILGSPSVEARTWWIKLGWTL